MSDLKRGGVFHSYLNNRSLGWVQTNGLVDRPKQFLLGQAIGHGDSLRSTAVVAGRIANHCMDGITITHGIIKTLDQQTCCTFTAAESRCLLVI